jgi:hypothetical protein
MRTAMRPRWTSLVISLPGQRGTARMRMWRALKGAGAAVLRDGVYLLPDNPTARAVLEEQAQAIRAAGGAAHVLPLDRVTPEQDASFRALFDREADYVGLIDRLRRLRAGLSRRGWVGAARALRVLQRECEALRAIDYFPGSAAQQAEELITELEAGVSALGSEGEPSARAGTITRLDPHDYRGRIWATRVRPWVDRMASAWLIRRFIDRKARFIWLKDPKRCPKRALGFDFDGATFTHVGSRVTFEVLAASFGLESDTALMRIGAIVHCLDVGGAPVAEAPGFAAVLAGARARLSSDDALLAEASRVFDNVYANFSQEQGD